LSNIFELNDQVGFDENLASFGEELARVDQKLGPALFARLGQLASPNEREDVLDALLAALQGEDQQ
jgi:hypothetical protein